MPLSVTPLSQFDFFPLCEGHHCLLPVSFAAEICAAFSLLFARVLGGVNPHNFLSKQLFDRLLDLDFVGMRRHPKHVLIVPFPEQTGFLGEPDIRDYLGRFLHATLSESLVRASLVTMILR